MQITPFYAYNVMAPTKDERNDSEWRTVAEKKVLRRGASTFYLGEGEIRSTCNLNKNVITIHIKYNEYSARGQCGGNPVGFLNVIENNVPIIKGEIVHDCMSTKQTAFLFDKAHGWQQCTGSGRSFDLQKDPDRSCAGLSISH